MKDYYYLLGVDAQASPETIKKAYRRLAAKFHPDANQGDAWFADRFREIREAYELLSVPSARADYDRELTSRLGQRYGRSMVDEETLSHRESMLTFKEEVLRRKQEELEAREAEVERLWHELRQWPNKYALTRPIYQGWKSFQAGRPVSGASLAFIPALVRGVDWQRVKQALLIKKGMPLLGMGVVVLLLFGFLHLRRDEVPVVAEATEDAPVQQNRYTGQIGGYEVVVQLDWKEGTDSLYGSYYFLRNEREVFALKGTNYKQGQLKLRGYLEGDLVTQIGLKKNLSDSNICWEGKLLNQGGILLDMGVCRGRE